MKNVVAISIIIMLPWMLISCKNEPGSNKTMIPRSPELIDSTGECQQAETSSQREKDEALGVIDFFGVKMQGKYEDIVNNINDYSMLYLN